MSFILYLYLQTLQSWPSSTLSPLWRIVAKFLAPFNPKIPAATTTTSTVYKSIANSRLMHLERVALGRVAKVGRASQDLAILHNQLKGLVVFLSLSRTRGAKLTSWEPGPAYLHNNSCLTKLKTNLNVNVCSQFNIFHIVATPSRLMKTKTPKRERLMRVSLCVCVCVMNYACTCVRVCVMWLESQVSVQLKHVTLMHAICILLQYYYYNVLLMQVAWLMMLQIVRVLLD